MNAVNPPIAANNKPMNNAIASGAASESTRADRTSARAIPIDTAVTATSVERASATVANNSTGRELDAAIGGDCDSCAVPVWMDMIGLRESVFFTVPKIDRDTGAGSSGLGRSR